MNIRELEKKEIKSVDEILDVVGFPVEREKLLNPRGKDTGYDSIFNKKTGDSLGVVGRDYQMITHRQALEQVMDVLDKNKLKIKPLKVQTVENGSRLFAQFMVQKKTKELDIPLRFREVGDKIAPGFMITNSYDRSLRFGTESYIYRLACTNGMLSQDVLFNKKKRHTKSLDVDSMVESFVEGFEQFDDQIVPQVEALTHQLVKPDDLQQELNEIPGWIQKEAIDYLIEGKWVNAKPTDSGMELELIDDLTRWDLLNSYTWVMSHSVTQNPKVAMDLNRKITDRFLGVAA